MADRSAEQLERALRDAVTAALADASGIESLVRLSGGASKETWAFDVVSARGRDPMVLRRAPGGRELLSAVALPLHAEAALIEAVRASGVPAPRVYLRTGGDSALGDGFVMQRVEGKSDALTVIHDPSLADVRPGLAFEVGAAAARVQAVKVSELPALHAGATLDSLYADYDRLGGCSAVLELALRWLRDNTPPPVPQVLVHGDFRTGNLVVGATGLTALIDWELAHLGDPMEDLTFLCVPSWRFGAIDRPVGGFGQLEDLFAGYESVRGEPVDRRRFHYFLVWSVAWWAVCTMQQLSAYRLGADRSLERAAIGRRLSECELDLLDLLEKGA